MQDIYINISFDDFSPRENFGLPNDRAMSLLLGLVNEFPQIKYTFFTIPNSELVLESKFKVWLKRRVQHLGIKNHLTAFKRASCSYLITNYSDWCDFVRSNVANGLFEIGQHGFNHYQEFDIPAAEFLYLNENDTQRKIVLGRDILSQLSPVNAFRPPAWGSNSFLEKTLLDLGFRFLSLDPKQKDLIYRNGVWYLPQQYSIESAAFSEDLLDKNYLFIKGHLPSSLENGVRDDTINNLRQVLKTMSQKFVLNFVFLRDLDELYQDGKLLGVKKYEI